MGACGFACGAPNATTVRYSRHARNREREILPLGEITHFLPRPLE
jgi:hypothetical protein